MDIKEVKIKTTHAFQLSVQNQYCRCRRNGDQAVNRRSGDVKNGLTHARRQQRTRNLKHVG